MTLSKNYVLVIKMDEKMPAQTYVIEKPKEDQKPKTKDKS